MESPFTLFVPIDTGTDHTQRFIINPLFILLVDAQMRSMTKLAEIFGLSMNSLTRRSK